MTLLVVQGLVKKYGGLLVTDNLDLEVKSGELHALIGPNGAGKTTLIQQLSGNIAPDAGRIIFDGTDITRTPPNLRARRGIARSYQITSAFPDLTVFENVALAVNGVTGHSFNLWRKMTKEARLAIPTMSILQQMSLTSLSGRRAGDLAHGDRRQLEMAMTLAMQPKLLLLDEPLAGLSSAESAQMSLVLADLKTRYTILLIEHDMDVVFSLADRVTVLVYGRAIATGTPREIGRRQDVKVAYLGEQDELEL